MIPNNRQFHYTGELTLKRSHILDSESKPKDDIVNWLFLKVGEYQFSFVYKIDIPAEASYDSPFTIKLSFMLKEVVNEIIQLNESYEVLRGSEIIGIVKITAVIE